MTMQPDQQQRILGDFLEEAREHLNTIEQGLLNLQSTLDDGEMIQEVFRAVHSIKCSAAMLGLSSIHHTSHRLEDCLKTLKHHPIQIDQTLESLVLGVFDTLKSLIDHLGSPFGLSEETAQELMSKTKSVIGISNPNNSYLTLAKIITTEIKQAQELVLQNRDTEIAVSQQLENLLPLRELELLEDSNLCLFSTTDQLNFDPEPSLLNTHQSRIISNNTLDHAGSQVGISELNNLADLFEIDIPELDDSWQQEKILENINGYQLPIIDSEVAENQQDLVDLLEFNSDQTELSLLQVETDLSLLFDDSLLEIENNAPSNRTDNYQSLESSQSLANETDFQFPENDVLEELISICRKARQNTLVSQISNSDFLEELDELSFNQQLTTPEIISELEIDPNTLSLPPVSKKISAHTPIITNKRTVKTPKITPSAPENLSLDSLFSKIEENIPPIRQEIDYLFSTSDTINNMSTSVDNLDNFWDDLNDLDIDIAANQNVAKELEESLLRASLENVSNNNSTQSDILNTDFNLTLENQSETFDIFFTVDTNINNQNIDILNQIPDITSTSTSPNTKKRSLPVTNKFSPISKTVNPMLEITRNSDAKKPPSNNPESIEILLENYLAKTKIEPSSLSTHQIGIQDKDFATLEALLNEYENNPPEINITQPAINQVTPVKTINTPSSSKLKDEFSEIEDLLAQIDQSISTTAFTPHKITSNIPRPSNSPRRTKEETMKIPVKQLDEMSNLIGELVVNRNILEQNHQQLRQSLDNLLVQVQHLSDAGARMQEYYERSLLESSLLTNHRTREHNEPGYRGFSEIEMDRFTPFHILAQEMIEFIVRTRESSSNIDLITEETEQVTRQLRQSTSQLQERLTKARMIPFSQTIDIDRLRRGVRDNAIKYGKQIELITQGADTLVDKMILDHLTDPLTHIIKNAIAHGIETPDIRKSIGKSPIGTITIRTLQQGNQTIISVSDDGAGIDHQKVKGRGIGMNVVQNDISKIRGVISTDSILGKGTTFTIRLPLTLSICKALLCICDRTGIAFPIDSVEDTLNIPAKNLQQDANGQSFIQWRDTILPLKPLKEILKFNRHTIRSNIYTVAKNDDILSVIILRSANTMIALQIDQILTEQEIVIKQLEKPVPKPTGIAGATVLGDGMIMPIADVLEIINIALCS